MSTELRESLNKSRVNSLKEELTGLDKAITILEGKYPSWINLVREGTLPTDHCTKPSELVRFVDEQKKRLKKDALHDPDIRACIMAARKRLTNWQALLATGDQGEILRQLT